MNYGNDGNNIPYPEDLGGKLDWIDPTHYRCGSGQLPWEEIRAIAPVVNIRVLEGAEIPSLYTQVEEGKMGFRRSESLMNPVGEIKLTSPQKVGAP